MSRTILAVFESGYSASKAARDLVNNGFPRELIDIATQEKSRTPEALNGEQKAVKTRSEIAASGQSAGAQIGAQVGSALGLAGGLLTALGALPIPGLALAGLAAPLAGTAISGLVGALAGSLMGQAIGLGIPEQEFRQYARIVRDDPVVMTILADWDSVDPVIQILNQHNPLDLQQKPVTRYRLGRFGATGNNIRNYGKRERHDRG